MVYVKGAGGWLCVSWSHRPTYVESIHARMWQLRSWPPIVSVAEQRHSNKQEDKTLET